MSPYWIFIIISQDSAKCKQIFHEGSDQIVGVQIHRGQANKNGKGDLWGGMRWAIPALSDGCRIEQKPIGSCHCKSHPSLLIDMGFSAIDITYNYAHLVNRDGGKIGLSTDRERSIIKNRNNKNCCVLCAAGRERAEWNRCNSPASQNRTPSLGSFCAKMWWCRTI